MTLVRMKKNPNVLRGHSIIFESNSFYFLEITIVNVNK